MKNLTIQQHNGPEIAYIRQEHAGDKLIVNVLFPKFKAEIDELLKRFEGKPLELMGGYEVESENGPIDVTTMRTLKPQDPDYIHALSEAISDARDTTIDGKRIRSWVVDENMDSATMAKKIARRCPTSYSGQGIDLLISQIDKMDAEIKKQLEKFLNTGEISDIEAQGYSIKKLKAEQSMNEVAAFLTLDFIMKEPEKAIASLKKGHDKVEF